jgi:hypothetical protein
MSERGFMAAKIITEGVKNLRQKSVLPDGDQRREICELLHHVLVDIREYSYEGRYLEAAELADIFHNIPNEMYGDGLWDLSALIERLETNHKKYGRRNYISHISRIFGLDSPRPVKKTLWQRFQ